jgi:hypothetical protein
LIHQHRPASSASPCNKRLLPDGQHGSTGDGFGTLAGGRPAGEQTATVRTLASQPTIGQPCQAGRWHHIRHRSTAGMCPPGGGGTRVRQGAQFHWESQRHSTPISYRRKRLWSREGRNRGSPYLPTSQGLTPHRPDTRLYFRTLNAGWASKSTGAFNQEAYHAECAALARALVTAASRQPSPEKLTIVTVAQVVIICMAQEETGHGQLYGE